MLLRKVAVAVPSKAKLYRLLPSPAAFPAKVQWLTARFTVPLFAPLL